MARSSRQTSSAPPRRWSKKVMETSDALDLEKGIFSSDSPRRIALSLKRSAEHSKRRKSEPYRSAMSMLTFFINRAGKRLPARRMKALSEAKDELRKLYGREPPGTTRKARATPQRGTPRPRTAKRSGSRKRSSSPRTRRKTSSRT